MQDYVEERNGGYYVAGTRIGLDSIIISFKQGESPESILESFPLAGPLVKIYGAITFYLENTEKVEAYLSELDRLAAEFKNPPLPPRLATQAGLKIRFIADANLNQKIVPGLLLREPQIDFQLPTLRIRDGANDPEVPRADYHTQEDSHSDCDRRTSPDLVGIGCDRIDQSGVAYPALNPGLEPLRGRIPIVKYDPKWPGLFDDQADRIRSALGDRTLRIEHVGSTSVPGLSAKPVIDIVLAVANSADEANYAPALDAAGYRLLIREPGWFEHRMFKGADPEVNLHVFSEGCEEIGRMLHFRDWLRENAADRELYERTKLALAQRKWKTVQDYADAKSAVVAEIMARFAPDQPV